MRFPKSYAVYDLETTSLDTATALPIELAVKIVRDGEVVEAKSTLIRHEGLKLSDETTRITGITDEMLQAEGAALTLDQVLVRFSALVGDLPLIGHNICRYDNIIINRLYRGIHPPGLLNFVDTAALFKARAIGEEQRWDENHQQFADRILSRRDPGVKYNLAYACQIVGVDISDLTAHRAMGDVEMTHRLYEKLMLSYEVK